MRFIDQRPNYASIISNFSEDSVKLRMQKILEISEKLIHESGLSEYLKTDVDLVEELVLDYFADVDRLKKFHRIDKINSIKVSAYTAYLVWMRRSIQIIKQSPDPNIKSSLRKIHSTLAIWILISFHFNGSDPIHKESDIKATPERYNDFFLYSDISFIIAL